MKRLAVSLTIVVMLLLVPIRPAYASDAENWASLEGWLSSINGKLALIYGEMENGITAAVDFGNFFNYPIQNNIPVRTYFNAMFTDISNTASRLSTNNTYWQNLVSTTKVNGRLGLYDLLEKMNSMSTALTQNNTYLSQLMSSSTQSGQIRLRNLANLLNTIDGDLDSVNSYLTDFEIYLDSIYNQQLADHSVLVNIYDVLGTFQSDMFKAMNNVLDGIDTINGNVVTVDKTLNSIDGGITTTNSLLQNQTSSLGGKLDFVVSAISRISIPSNAELERLVNATNNQLTIIQGQLDRILLYLVVSDVQNDLIGDFDWIAVGDEISTLSNAASNKMPFAAFGFFGSLTGLAIFSSTPSQLPEISIPFNFSGTNQTLTISNAMMNQAQPYIHFAVLLMFMYCLAVVTMRFVYYD